MGAWLVAAFLPALILIAAAVFFLEMPPALFWLIVVAGAIVFAYRRGRDDVFR